MIRTLFFVVAPPPIQGLSPRRTPLPPQEVACEVGQDPLPALCRLVSPSSMDVGAEGSMRVRMPCGGIGELFGGLWYHVFRSTGGLGLGCEAAPRYSGYKRQVPTRVPSAVRCLPTRRPPHSPVSLRGQERGARDGACSCTIADGEQTRPTPTPLNYAP